MIGNKETQVNRRGYKVQGTVTKEIYFSLTQIGQGQCPIAGVGKEIIIRFHEPHCYVRNLRWVSDPLEKLRKMFD